jgi:hypothetical protein
MLETVKRVADECKSIQMTKSAPIGVDGWPRAKS